MGDGEVRDSGFCDLCAGANEERIAKVCIWRENVKLESRKME